MRKTQPTSTYGFITISYITIFELLSPVISISGVCLYNIDLI